jgi:hypothetical protein
MYCIRGGGEKENISLNIISILNTPRSTLSHALRVTVQMKDSVQQEVLKEIADSHIPV